MKRLYYLADTLDSTEKISRDIHAAGITDWRFHVISRDEAGLYRRHVQSATLLQRLDFMRDYRRGLLIGLLLAVVITTLMRSIELFGPGAGIYVYGMMFIIIALFGGWLGGLIGVAAENRNLRDFHKEIDAGKYLIMIDVRRAEEARIKGVMTQAHPDTRLLRETTTTLLPVG